MWKDTINTTIFQLYRLLFENKFLNYLQEIGVDRYAKKLFTTQLLALLISAQLKKHEGLRAISDSLNQEDFQQVLKLDSISASQISRRLNQLPSEVLHTLLKHLIITFQIKVGTNKLRNTVDRIYLIDSSTISMCLSQYRWAEFRKTKGGVKLHLRLEFHENGVYPDFAIITQAKPADKTQMDALVVQDPDAINVFDRGYMDYDKFDSYCENGIRFVSRLKKNAVIEVIEECKVQISGHITSDRIVHLGTKGITKMKNPLRLIETIDTEGKPFIIVTNDFSLDAEDISTIYRNRWKIELFFKWIKQNLSIKHFYGLSRQAVINQILVSLITYCLIMLVKIETGFDGTLTRIKRLLITCSFEPFEVFTLKLLKKPKRRRKVDHETQFKLIERQVMSGNADCFYNLSYDSLYV